MRNDFKKVVTSIMNWYTAIKGFSIARSFNYSIIALSIAYKYYETKYYPGSLRFSNVISKAYRLTEHNDITDKELATCILSDVIKEYLTNDIKDFKTKYCFSEEDIKAIEELSNMTTQLSSSRRVVKKTIMPNFFPKYNVEELSKFIEEYASLNGYYNTLIALNLAIELHNGEYRKSGEPYIIHPLVITSRIIYSGSDDDIILAAALLHDVIEDVDEMQKCNGELLISRYKLDPEVVRIVRILSKPKDYKVTDPGEIAYYAGIKNDINASLIKIFDRTDNIATIEFFKTPKMVSYIEETKKLVYPLLDLKNYYPGYSQTLTNLKYVLRSNCEVIEAMLKNIPEEIDPYRHQKTFYFISGYACGKKMHNTLAALDIILKIHDGQKRATGDDFIIHPIRVALYLINLKINDDETIAAALLHEAFKVGGVTDGGKELTEEYKLSPEVFQLVKLVSKPENMSKDNYYKNLFANLKALLIKLSNRANTCTKLHTYSPLDIKEYLDECHEYIYPMCDHGIENYPEYANQINIMRQHIHQITNIVSVLKDIH